MAEKNFKITGGLALGDYALTANGLSLLWDSNALATQAYVTNAVSVATVNTNAIAESLASSTLYVNSGDNLNVNVNAFVNDLDGSGLYVTGNTLNVNTNAFASNFTQSNRGTIYQESGRFDVNINAIAGTGLVGGYSSLSVNTNAIATRDYVDSVAQGLDVKASVKAATVENIDLGIAPVAFIDSIAVTSGDRFLFKNQTTTSENGIYIYNGSAFVRAADADTTADFNKGAFTFVESGTHAGQGFVVTAAGTLGTDAITWAQFSEAGTLTAGSGIIISAGAVSVNTNAVATSLASSTLYVNSGDNLNVNVNAFVDTIDGSGLYVSDNLLAVNTNAIAESLASSTLYVNSGDNLNVNVNAFVNDLDGSGLYVTGNQLAINTNAFASNFASSTIYVDQGDNLNVNTNAFTTSNRGTIFTSGGLLDVNVNAMAGTGLVGGFATISLDQYAARVILDGTSASNNGSSITTDTLYANQASVNTYVTVGTIGMNKAFTLDVWMKVNDSSSTSRKSTVSGITDGYGNVEYTEYAIVDSSVNGAVLFPDVLIDFDSGVYRIRAKSGESTMKYVVESKTFSL